MRAGWAGRAATSSFPSLNSLWGSAGLKVSPFPCFFLECLSYPICSILQDLGHLPKKVSWMLCLPSLPTTPKRYFIPITLPVCSTQDVDLPTFDTATFDSEQPCPHSTVPAWYTVSSPKHCTQMNSIELNDEDDDSWRSQVLGPSRKEPFSPWAGFQFFYEAKLHITRL